MKNININVSKKYDVIIKYGILKEAGTYIKAAVGGDVAVIVTDDKVDVLYSETLYYSLIQSGYEVEKFVFPNGEASKNSDTYIRLLNFLAQKKVTRNDVICALGGGVTGDLAGFCAATFLRGVSYVQIPTTLLAAVDSSVGGKTAIDLECGKNLAGAFYQPNLVLCDYSTLATLDKEVFNDGCAEVIKYGIIMDEELFYKLKNVLNLDMTTYENDFIEEIIGRCVYIKRDIVMQDECDNGIRQILNFGHTIGHAYEACSEYKITHGSAVAMGMAAIAKAAKELNICNEKVCEDILNILTQYGFNVRTNYNHISNVQFQTEDIFNIITSDKKRNGKSINLIFPQAIGRCIINKLDIMEIKKVLKEAGI